MAGTGVGGRKFDDFSRFYLPEVANAVHRYKWIIDKIPKTNVAEDLQFQTIFKGFYRMGRRNADWYKIYFDVLEKEKRNSDVNFDSVLRKIYLATGRIEASFASKMVASIDPTRPVYDSIVRQHLGIPSRSYGAAEDRIKKLCADYEKISQFHADSICHPNFGVIRDAFNLRFPQWAGFADEKVVDLLLWQTR